METFFFFLNKGNGKMFVAAVTRQVSIHLNIVCYCLCIPKVSFTPFCHYTCPEHSIYIQFSLILSQETHSSQAPHTANTAGLNKFQSVKWNDPIHGERLPCREVCHEEFWDQLLEGDWLVRVLRTDDVLLLHCSQHTVLHVKVVNAASIIVCQLVLAQWGAEGTGGVLLYEETPITLTGCQSYNTYTGSAACFSFSDSGFQIWIWKEQMMHRFCSTILGDITQPERCELLKQDYLIYIWIGVF